MSDDNLWGTLPLEEKIETPASVLRTQAVALGKLTSGLLEGRVVSGKTSRGKLAHNFRIVAPALGNYSIEILSVAHDVQLYPATVFWTDEMDADTSEEVSDTEELKEKLSKIFQSKYTRKVVSALLAQVREAGAPSDEDDDIPF